MTRYFGIDGTIHMRIGQSSDEIILPKHHISLKKDGQVIAKDYVNEYDNAKFKISQNINGKKFEIKVLEYVPSLEKEYVLASDDEIFSQDSSNIFYLMISNHSHSAPLELFLGDRIDIDGVKFVFLRNCEIKNSSNLCFFFKNDQPFLKTDQKIIALNPKTNQNKTISKDEAISVENGLLYSIGGLNFSLISALKNGTKSYKKSGAMPQIDGFLLQASYDDRKRKLWIVADDETSFYLLGEKYVLQADKERAKMPFKIRLDDFLITRYPGSNSPSGYFSHVSIIQDEKIATQAQIYSNHVLDFDGYRFFQTSYDKDELGSLLSASKDPGKHITYIGYALLCIGLLLNLFSKKSRFYKLLYRKD